jgi:hypothetical protein
MIHSVGKPLTRSESAFEVCDRNANDFACVEPLRRVQGDIVTIVGVDLDESLRMLVISAVEPSCKISMIDNSAVVGKSTVAMNCECLSSTRLLQCGRFGRLEINFGASGMPSRIQLPDKAMVIGILSDCPRTVLVRHLALSA